MANGVAGVKVYKNNGGVFTYHKLLTDPSTNSDGSTTMFGWTVDFSSTANILISAPAKNVPPLLDEYDNVIHDGVAGGVVYNFTV